MEGRKRRGGAADEGFGANSNVLCCRKFTRKGICAPIFASLSNAKGWSAPSNLSVQVCQCFDRCPAGLSLALKTCTLVKLLRARERGACALRDDVSLRCCAVRLLCGCCHIIIGAWHVGLMYN